MNASLKKLLKRLPLFKMIFNKLDELYSQIDELRNTNLQLDRRLKDLMTEEENLNARIDELKSKIRQDLPSLNYTEYDEFYLDPEVPLSNNISHQKWQRYLYEIGNKPGMRILEIGSREVTAPSEARKEFSKATYTGFDIYPGNNVDIVGDAHKLSSYFNGGEAEKFDLIFSSACFEHFAMPWIVAEEISKMLKTGGLVFIETHFSYSSHERPWHFFQFSDQALKALFSKALGFECIEAGMSNPMVGRFSILADEYLRAKPISGLYCHSEYLGKKTAEVEDFTWEKLDLTELVGETKYPAPK